MTTEALLGRLERVVQETVEASHLSTAEKEELAAELYSFFEDYIQDLRLQGLSDEKIITTIMESFGSTEQIGKQMYYAHRRLERIPWFGPLLAYAPVRVGVVFFLINITIQALLFRGFLNLSGKIYDAFEAGMITEWQMQILDYTFSLILPILAVIALGFLLSRKMRNLSEYTEACFLSILPFIMISVFMVALVITSGYPGLAWERYFDNWGIIFYIILASLIVVPFWIGGVAQFWWKKYQLRNK